MLFTKGYCVREAVLPCLFSFAYPERRVRLLDEGREPATDWLVDESGNIAAQFTYHDEKKLWEIKTRKERHWTLVASGIAPIDTPDMLGFNADGSSIVVRFTVNGEPEWRPLNLSDNTWGSPLARGASFTRHNRGSQNRPNHRRHYARLAAANTFFSTMSCRPIGTQCCEHSPMNACGSSLTRMISLKLVLKIFGPKHGYVYALYDWYSPPCDDPWADLWRC